MAVLLVSCLEVYICCCKISEKKWRPFTSIARKERDTSFSQLRIGIRTTRLSTPRSEDLRLTVNYKTNIYPTL